MEIVTVYKEVIIAQVCTHRYALFLQLNASINCAEQVIYGIDEAVMTMQEGEIATFTIPPQHAFGAVGSDQYKLAIVPPDSVVIYEIELLSVVNVSMKLFLFGFESDKSRITKLCFSWKFLVITSRISQMLFIVHLYWVWSFY